MRVSRYLIGLLTVGFLFVAMVPAARAQDDALEVGIGYAGGHASSEGDGEGFPFGFSLQAGKYIKSDAKKKIGVFGNLVWKHHGEEDISNNITSFLLGARIAGASQSDLSPFGKVILGFSRNSFSAGSGQFALDGSDSAFAFGAGGGIRKKLNDKRAVDAEIAIIRHFYDSAVTEIQFTVMLILLNLGK